MFHLSTLDAAHPSVHAVLGTEPGHAGGGRSMRMFGVRHRRLEDGDVEAGMEGYRRDVSGQGGRPAPPSSTGTSRMAVAPAQDHVVPGAEVGRRGSGAPGAPGSALSSVDAPASKRSTSASARNNDAASAPSPDPIFARPSRPIGGCGRSGAPAASDRHGVHVLVERHPKSTDGFPNQLVDKLVVAGDRLERALKVGVFALDAAACVQGGCGKPSAVPHRHETRQPHREVAQLWPGDSLHSIARRVMPNPQSTSRVITRQRQGPRCTPNRRSPRCRRSHLQRRFARA